MEAVRALPFVKEAVQVAHYEKSPLNIDKNRLNLLSQEPHEPDTSYYAQGVFQITSLNGLPLHEAGFRGEGMCIAVIDGGFLNSDTIPAMQNTRIVGTYNFVMPGVSVFDWNNDHGQAVLSCMGDKHPTRNGRHGTRSRVLASHIGGRGTRNSPSRRITGLPP